MSCAPAQSIVLVGLMGAGKTSVGRRLARRLSLPFTDADDEIVKAAGLSIEEIFERYGEAAFRASERRIIMRLLDAAPHVLATGGGAFMDADTRSRIKQCGVSVWLRASLEVLVQRTSGRNDRPLLKNRNARAALQELITERYPIYAEADIVVDTDGESLERTVQRIIDALKRVHKPALMGNRP